MGLTSIKQSTPLTPTCLIKATAPSRAHNAISKHVDLINLIVSFDPLSLHGYMRIISQQMEAYCGMPTFGVHCAIFKLPLINFQEMLLSLLTDAESNGSQELGDDYRRHLFVGGLPHWPSLITLKANRSLLVTITGRDKALENSEEKAWKKLEYYEYRPIFP
ncbi:hypothetical protein POTOM_002006 [Populus tomentosa]|uniref:Uncharacterized protein n=1 Tax=Populus tomentosa TaxID=118781 RepID=A0A8X8DJ43_POPTO|nr:hypothetical protein POTOM_002006 [Populus tomentosa]